MQITFQLPEFVFGNAEDRLSQERRVRLIFKAHQYIMEGVSVTRALR
jgi:hypothetical protein